MKKTVLYVKIPKGIGLSESELIDKILSSSKTKFTSIKYDKSLLRIEFHTNDYLRKEVIHSIRNILFQYTKKIDENLKQYSTTEISRLAGSALPIDPLVELLKIEGFQAYKSKNGVETNTPLEILNKILINIAEKYREIIKLKSLTKPARSLLTVLIYIFPEKGINDILCELHVNGYLIEKENKISVSQDWRKILCKLYLMPQTSSKSPRVCD